MGLHTAAGRCVVIYSCLAALAILPRGSIAEDFSLRSFQRTELTGTYFSEGIAVGDLNGDNKNDVVYGPTWFAGPDFSEKHEVYAAVPQPMERYADNFFSWIYDFDRDGANDIFVVGFPGTPAYVYRNPGKGIGSWVKHQVFDWVSNESPHFTDVLGDKTPELVCTRDGFFGFATIDPADPLGSWKFHPISEKVTATKFGHGLGVGDVNGDGRQDILHAGGWYEQPIDKALVGRWREHQVKFSSSSGGAEMYAYDVDGDGDNDIITSESAHNFGLSWYEQTSGGEFKQRLIMGANRSENKYGVLFSELHSVALADMDGDGLKDIVTGKTYWSHHRQSPMWDAGAVVYWFKLVRGQGEVDWLPYEVDATTGIGRQVTVADIDGDGLLDVATGGMLGAHVLIQSQVSVSAQRFDAAQPKVYDGPASGTTSDASRARGPRSPIAADGKVDNAIEGESLNVRVTGGAALPQAMQGFSADNWSGNRQLWWRGAKPGDKLSFELDAFEDIAAIEMAFTCARDYGIVQLILNDKPVGKPIDLYNTQVVSTGLLTFKLPLNRGKSTLAFEIVGANPKAVPAYMFGLDFIRFEGRAALARELPAGRRPVIPTAIGATDQYPHAGLDAEAAAAAMQVPPGFTVTVCASEPDVKQPIAMALDDRGRTWIAEAYEYPLRADGERGRDRILVFEDTNGDGKFDSRKVFAEGLNLVSGLEVGFGGVWVGAAPYLLFIPDANGDDVADSEPQILLDGWGYEDTHETLNTFCWGPDGWLYGCHGVFTHSRVGKPGTPPEQRVPINAGVWRYHPLRHHFEVFAHGTSNPWGVDFNQHGEAFVTACVIPHLYHMIPAARYHRQAGQHFNQYTYDDIKTIADHLHYLGVTPHSGNGRSDAAGGGHAHAGAMFYQGGAWPKEYAGALFMNNIHGQRLNTDLLEPAGSGYVGHHGPDFLLTGDSASQILNMRYGPDGQVIFIDWYDMQACHRREAEVHDRSNGRIYKCSFGKSAPVQIDLTKLDDLELAELCLHENDWFVRHARRILQERAAQRKIDMQAIDRLVEVATTHADDTRRLRAMWARHAVGVFDLPFVGSLLKDTSPHVRSWTLRLAMEQKQGKLTEKQLGILARLAAEDPSPIMRRAIASAVDQLPLAARWPLVEGLIRHAEDASDHNLPLMYWYIIEPLADIDPDRALALGMAAGEYIPLLRQFMLRRVGGTGEPQAIQRLTAALVQADSPEIQLTFLLAMRSALSGRRSAEKPPQWDELAASLSQSSNSQVALQAAALGATFGDQTALRKLRSLLSDSSVSPELRTASLSALLGIKDSLLLPILLELVRADTEAASVRQAAIGGLAQYDAPAVAATLLKKYSQLNADQRRIAIATLCSRAASAKALLKSIADKEIAASDLTADLARQLEFLGDAQVSARLSAVWGQLRENSADKAKLMDDYRQLIARTDLPEADPALGKATFAKTCQRCHMLYGAGEKLGPDLTGSNRANIDYLLENIVDPSSVMAREYRQSVFLTDDGQVITGILRSENETAVTVQTAEATLVIPKDEIAQRKASNKSMMPDNQLSQFTDHEIRSLISYLRGN